MIINTSKKDKQRLVQNITHTADPIISTSASKTPKAPTVQAPPANGVTMHFVGTLATIPTIAYDNEQQCQIGDVIRLPNGKFYVYMLADNGKSYAWRQLDENLETLIGQLRNDVYLKSQLSTSAQIRKALEDYALTSNVSSISELSEKFDELSEKFDNYYVSSNTSSSYELSEKFNDIGSNIEEIDSRIENLENSGYTTSSEVSGIVKSYGFTTNDDLEDFKKFITDTIKVNNEQWTDINSIQIIANNNAKEIIQINTKLNGLDFSKYALSSDVSDIVKNINNSNFATKDEVDLKFEDYAKTSELAQASSEITSATQVAITDATSRITNLENASNTYGVAITNQSNLISKVKDYAEGTSAAVASTIESYGYSTKDDLNNAIDNVEQQLKEVASAHATKDSLELSVHNLRKQLNNLDYCKLSDFAEVSSKFYTTNQTSSKYEINDAINDVYQYAADAYLLKSKAYETFAKNSDVSTAQQLADKFASIDEKTTSSQVCALIDEREYANKMDVGRAIAELWAKLKFDYVDIPTFNNVSSDINQRQTILECAVRHHHERIDALEKAIPTLATKDQLISVENSLSNYAKISSVYYKSETSSAQEIANAVQELRSIAFDPNILSNYFTKNQISTWYERIQRNDDRIDELYEHDYHLQKGIDKNHDDIDKLRELLKSIPQTSATIDVSDIRRILQIISSDYTTSAQTSAIVSAMIAGIKPSEFDPNVLSDYALSADVYSQAYSLSTEIVDLISKTSCNCETSNYFDLRENISNDVSGSQYIGFSKLYDKEPTFISNDVFDENDSMLALFKNVKQILFYISSDEEFQIDEKFVNDIFYQVDYILSTEPSLSSYEYDAENANVQDTADAIDYIIGHYYKTNVSLAQKLKMLSNQINLLYKYVDANYDKFANYYTKTQIDRKLSNISVDSSALLDNYIPTSVYNIQINNLTQELAETKQELQETTEKLHKVVFTLVTNLSSNDNMILISDIRSAIVSATVELSAFL